MTTATVMRPVSRALGTTEVALNYFEVEPGDAFSIGFHTHQDQEEVIYVLSGTATWETEDGKITVTAGEVVRFAPASSSTATTTTGATRRSSRSASVLPRARRTSRWSVRRVALAPRRGWSGPTPRTPSRSSVERVRSSSFA